MAKKKESLSLEERLESTLLSEWEQPYKVPSNWVWTKIAQVVSLHRGVSYKKTDVHIVKLENDCLILRGGNIEEGSINIECSDNVYVDKSLVSDKQMIQENDIIIVSSTGSIKVIGRAGIANVSYSDISFGAFLTLARPHHMLHKIYVSYFFQSDLYRQRIRSLASGVNINNIRNEYIYETSFPLPPLAEQQRIADRIESMFSKLDEARKKVQTSLDSFEKRKAAILHKAFTGELTQKWRDENGVSLDSWKETILDQVCEKITDGTHKSPENSPYGEFMYITAKNIKEDGISLSNITYVSKKDFQEIYSRCNVEKNDVLYIKDGATTGIATINQLEFPFAMLSSVALLKPKKEATNPKYIAYHLNAPRTKAKMISNMSGNAITRLTLTKIKASSIIMPTPPEQTEIVRILDNIFEKEQQAKELANVIEKIDLMKKAILARAFRGELGTNDLEEESAMELLRAILEVKP